jgi:hypothetical protein
MKKILFFCVIISVCGCKTEGDVEPANESTFIRYLGTEDNNSAVLAFETTDGFSLLSNAESEGGDRKIKFTQTDLYGHTVWEQNYPSVKRNWSAASFIETTDSQLPNSGYLIIGDSIKGNGITDLLLLKIDKQGTLIDSVTISAPNSLISLHGRAVMKDPADGNYIVLGNATGDPSPVNDMFVAKLDADDLSIIMWSKEYGAGLSTTTNRIYFNNNQNLFWGGSVRTPSYDVRLVQVPIGSQSPITGNNIGSPQFDENALDFCQSFGGWAFTGSFKKYDTEDIFVLKVDSKGDTIRYTPFAEKDYDVRYPKDVGAFKGYDGQNEKGVSITSTKDDGFVVLGQVSTATKSEDLTIVKLDATGKKVWQYNYGGADRQEAASVRETSDGSYLIFGTTYFINEKKLMLIKVNRDGKL